MISPASSSDPESEHRPAANDAYEQLHPKVQKWIWDQQWTQLRANQIQAIPPILASNTDVIISGATASGKTEAAWLPICSVLARDEDTGSAHLGVKALYISPLKALINDQARRLSTLGDYIDIPVARRHGDVHGAERDTFRRNPDGILLITPESLEAMFVLDGPRIPSIFNGLRFVVVDELHSFIGTERGAQLQSLLHRIEIAVQRRIPRIALSATIADTSIAAEFLRPGEASGVTLVGETADQQGDLRMQLRGYMRRAPRPEPNTPSEEYHGPSITDHLYSVLRGRDNLVFANSRNQVELYADRLKSRALAMRVPNEFFPHHGSLSREFREDVETRLKSPEQPATAICTSTLEMGIDIGSVDSIAQIGSPGSAAALRQRLGRSGRRGKPATLRIYITEPEITSHTPLPDMLRTQLVETIAIADLLLERWYEPPNIAGLHLSTLIQQILSIIAQHGGANAAAIYNTLCTNGPFQRVTSAMFMDVLRDLGRNDLIIQSTEGTLLPGVTGERLINHYSFYTAFQTAEEYRLTSEGKPIGTIPITYPVLPESNIIFAGQRWQVVDVNTETKVIDLVRARGGKPPIFSGAGPIIADGIRQRMKQVYEQNDLPGYLDPPARQLLAEARQNYRHLGIADTPVLGFGSTVWLFPWKGDRVMNTLSVLFTTHGVRASRGGAALSLHDISEDDVHRIISTLLAEPLPDPARLAAFVSIKEQDKYDEYLGEDLLNTAYAARDFDLPGAWSALDELHRHITAIG